MIFLFVIVTLVAAFGAVLWLPAWLLLDGGNRSARALAVAPRLARSSSPLFGPPTPRLR